MSLCDQIRPKKGWLAMSTSLSITKFLNLAKQGDPGTPATPAPVLAAGSEHIVQVTNSRVTWAKKDGVELKSVGFQTIFPEITNVENPNFDILAGDPNVLYDTTSNRFILIAHETRGHLTTSNDQDNLARIHIAVSKSNNPNDGWYTSAIDLETDSQKTGHFPDIPSITIDRDKIYISANYLSFEGQKIGNPFDGRAVWVLEKGEDNGGFYSGGEPKINWLGTPSSLAGIRAEDYSEVHDKVLWFGATQDAFRGGLGLVYIDQTSNEGFSTVLLKNQDQFDIKFGNGQPYIQQPNTSKLLFVPGNPIDDIDIVGDTLYFVTAFPDKQNGSEQQSIFWGQADISDYHNPFMLKSGVIDGESIAPNTSVFLPAIAANSEGFVGISFAASGENTYFGSYFVAAQAANFGESVLPIKVGSGIVEQSQMISGHFGDSSSLVVDPSSQKVFWASNTWVSSDGRWNTFGAEISAIESSFPSPGAELKSEITILTDLSGGPLIDAMFGTDEATQVPVVERAGIIGKTIGKWGGELGTGATISYSFYDSSSFFPSNYPSQYINEIGIMPEAMKQAHREAFAAWASVADVRFVEVSETDLQVGDIRIGISKSNPNTSQSFQSAEAVPPFVSLGGSGSAPQVGDIFYSSAFEGTSAGDFDPGKSAYRTVVHEVAHAVFGFGDVSVSKGLNGKFLPAELNYQAQTIMSYSIAPGATVGDGNFFPGASNELVRGPMVLDVQAAQWLYGPNNSIATGDDLYIFSPSQAYYQTIWDAGGIDTISAIDTKRGVYIDLQPGSLSDLGSGVTAETSDGVLALKTVGIAFGTTIENVVGGSGGDTIIGNAAANIITGGGGNDNIDAGAGEDTAQIAAAISAATITINANGTINVTDRNGSEGTDSLVNIEALAFADKTLDLNAFSSLTQLNGTQFKALAEVYVAYFNRAADAEGLYFWADKLAEGMDMATIASYFSQSAEAKALYPNTADTSAFVTAVYANVLGRTPDAEGFEFWTTNLNNGSMQPATFVLSIIGGAQGADITYLSKKADLGVYFAAIKGMSDVADAQNVLNTFGDQATSNTAGAKASVDGHFTDASASGGGDFLFNLVGIVGNPFPDGV